MPTLLLQLQIHVEGQFLLFSFDLSSLNAILALDV